MNPRILFILFAGLPCAAQREVRLEDLVECEEIFSTLMGDDVESRRRFIETNALDVRNLDV